MNERTESFAVEDGLLVRRVTPKRGAPYEHRCPLDAYGAVAHAVDDAGGAPITGDEIQRATDLPFSQVATALAFLKERGCVVPAHGRRHKAAPGNAGVHLDAMTEVHALREKGPADPAFGYE
ncbi:MAG: hypothetical protein DYG93_13660 [Leptolyngbya sp. PLA2]|nr:hypothetical protein [Leptolyngbya sp.]MCE7972694.1 hypothetical protein [Leptolyngbya sp. PL-A2]MCQ3939470.1 hypothetical protein [cyanobacterium CYA1]MDL1903728.1 hypothetical protein [Synechococcales cyanobacterium CNB]